MQNQVQTSRDYANDFIGNIVDALPTFLGALLILIVGYIIAKVLAAITKKILQKANFNRYVSVGKGGSLIQKAIPNPTSFISSVVFWVLFLFMVSVAVSALGIPALVEIVNGIYGYLPNVLAAFLIFLVAGGVSATVSALAHNTMGDTPTGKIAASSVPVVIMGLAAFMILNQLKIAPEIVTITYAGLVATATLAFGLGGKDAASKLFLELYETGQKNKESVTRDLQKGAARAKAKAQNVRNKTDL